MLNEQEKSAILAIWKDAPDGRAVAVEALMTIQDQRGHISDNSLNDIAEFLGMTPDELDSLATFYSFIFRRPVGRHVIYVCDGVTCYIMGCDGILGHLKRRLGIELGGTTGDGRFTLVPVSCIGACDHSPAMMIDGALHGDLDENKIDEILKEYR